MRGKREASDTRVSEQRGDFVDEGTLDALVRFRQYGHEYDPDLELYLAGGQFYSPGAGRLMSPNAAAELAGQNPYRFAGNSPERVTGAGTQAEVTSARGEDFWSAFGQLYNHYNPY